MGVQGALQPVADGVQGGVGKAVGQQCRGVQVGGGVGVPQRQVQVGLPAGSLARAVAFAGGGGQHGVAAILWQRGPVQRLAAGKGDHVQLEGFTQHRDQPLGRQAGFRYAVGRRLLLHHQAQLARRWPQRLAVSGEGAAPGVGKQRLVGGTLAGGVVAGAAGVTRYQGADALLGLGQPCAAQAAVAHGVFQRLAAWPQRSRMAFMFMPSVMATPW